MRYFSRDLWVECWSSQDSCASNSQGFESFTVPFKVLVLKGVLCVRRKDRPGCELSDLAHRAAEWHLRHCNTGLVTEILQQRSSCRKVLQQRSCCRIFFATEILLQIFFFFATKILLQIFCNGALVVDFFFFCNKDLVAGKHPRRESERGPWVEREVRKEREEGRGKGLAAECHGRSFGEERAKERGGRKEKGGRRRRPLARRRSCAHLLRGWVVAALDESREGESEDWLLLRNKWLAAEREERQDRFFGDGYLRR